ncbi:unnamed protein product [Lactuca saligna]|uniref:Uncharacterized protein n=1 Tax=Lactuca saligna TaxID=75948 RepID=A0AA35VJA9_LACSI|nr:unnamed protein product [Lactuca saligna]
METGKGKLSWQEESLHFGGVVKGNVNASADNTVTRLVFDHEKEDLLGCHDAPVRCIEYSYATGKVITGSWDKTLKCWDPRGGGAQERAMEFFDAMAPIILCLQTCSISCFWMGEDYDDEKPLSSKYTSKSKVGSSNNHKPVVPKVHQNGSASKDNNQLRNIGLNKRPTYEERSASVKKPKLSDFVTPINHKPTRLQAQAAGVTYSHPMTNLMSRMAVFGPNMMFADLRCSPSCTRAGVPGTVSICPPDCFEYKGTLDVFYKIIWQMGIYLPCYDIFRNWFEEFAAENAPSMTLYAPLLVGSLSRSLACTTCYPIELARTHMQTFKDFNTGKKAPGVWKMLLNVKNNGNLDIKLLH